MTTCKKCNADIKYCPLCGSQTDKQNEEESPYDIPSSELIKLYFPMLTETSIFREKAILTASSAGIAALITWSTKTEYPGTLSRCPFFLSLALFFVCVVFAIHILQVNKQYLIKAIRVFQKDDPKEEALRDILSEKLDNYDKWIGRTFFIATCCAAASVFIALYIESNLPTH